MPLFPILVLVFYRDCAQRTLFTRHPGQCFRSAQCLSYNLLIGPLLFTSRLSNYKSLSRRRLPQYQPVSSDPSSRILLLLRCSILLSYSADWRAFPSGLLKQSFLEVEGVASFGWSRLLSHHIECFYFWLLSHLCLSALCLSFRSVGQEVPQGGGRGQL
jgi:hypothetical protein